MRLSTVFRILAVLLSDVMCALVGYYYADMLWGIRCAGYSAPAEIAFLPAIPFTLAIAACLLIAHRFAKRGA